MKYAALLRGINVGGANKVPMPELKTVFENAGFADVSTYINSGNVIFSSGQSDIEALQKKCQDAIFAHFNLDIPVAVISQNNLAAALDNAPSWWDNGPESKHNAIFIIAPATTPEIMEQIGELKPEYELIGSHGQVIFWSAPVATFSRTRLSKIITTSAYRKITIRNANTTKKLLHLMQK